MLETEGECGGWKGFDRRERRGRRMKREKNWLILRNEAKKLFVINKSFPQKPKPWRKATASRGKTVDLRGNRALERDRETGGAVGTLAAVIG